MHTSTKLPQGKYQTRTEAEKRKKKGFFVVKQIREMVLFRCVSMHV